MVWHQWHDAISIAAEAATETPLLAPAPHVTVGALAATVMPVNLVVARAVPTLIVVKMSLSESLPDVD